MIIMLALTTVAFVDIFVSSESSGPAISATKIEEKPEIFLVVDDPDFYFLKAIAHEGAPVFLGLFGDTTIDELITLHNTTNISYLGEFFVVYRFSIDAFSFGPYLLQVAIVGWILVIIYQLISNKSLKF